MFHFFKCITEPGMVAHTCNPSSWEAEAGGSSQVGDQPRLQNEPKASLNFTGDLGSKMYYYKR